MAISPDSEAAVVRKDPEDFPARQEAAEASRGASTRAALVSAFTRDAESPEAAEADAARCMRLAPQLRMLPQKEAQQRLEVLQQAIPDANVLRHVLLGAPSLLLQSSLPRSLPSKFEAVSAATGLPVERACCAAPALLLLNATKLSERLDRVSECLPEELTAQLPSMIRRAPRLLGYRPESLRAAFDELHALLPPECDAADMVARQPTLLANSHERLRSKLERLRAVCTPSEFRALCGSASLGRALTASDAVIERLRRAEDGERGVEEPRPVVKILLMTRREWEAGEPMPTSARRGRKLHEHLRDRAAPRSDSWLQPGVTELTFRWRVRSRRRTAAPAE